MYSFMYKASNNLLPRNIQGLYKQVNSTHSYSTRQKNDLFVQVNLDIRKHNISYAGVQIWSNTSVVSFKKKLKKKKIIINQY